MPVPSRPLVWLVYDGNGVLSVWDSEESAITYSQSVRMVLGTITYVDVVGPLQVRSYEDLAT